MKRILTIVLFLTAFSWITSAKQIEERIAGKVAGNFFASGHEQSGPCHLIGLTSTIDNNQDGRNKPIPGFYVTILQEALGCHLLRDDML